MKREISIAIASLVGFIMLFDYGVTYAPLQSTAKALQGLIPVAAAFAAFLGIIGMNQRAVKQLRRGESKIYNTVLMLSMWITIVVGLSLRTTSKMYQWIFDSIMTPGGTAIYGLLGFFVVSAALRAYRMRTKESIVMGVATLLTLFGSTAVGVAISPETVALSQWLMDVPFAGASVGIIVGMGVGGATYLFRVLIARETRWIGEQ